MTLIKTGCKLCGKKIVGRTDKIFCSRKCKNKASYSNKVKQKKVTESIDQILHRNYEILKEILGDNYTKIKIPYLTLAKRKFNFNYITNYKVNKQGKIYHYIYDLAWMSFSDNEVLIIKEGKR